MLRRTSEALATEFLRKTLADDALRVSELEATARAKGLLREDQSITHLKAFKLAKKSLGIRSVRAVSAGRGLWLWELPGRSERSSKPERRAPPLSPVPIEWSRGVARLNPHRPPDDVPRHRWRQFVDDCERFLTASEKWPERAYRLGWDTVALFGCAPERLLEYSGCAGHLWAINGGKLIELHRDPCPGTPAHISPPQCGSG